MSMLEGGEARRGVCVRHGRNHVDFAGASSRAITSSRMSTLITARRGCSAKFLFAGDLEADFVDMSDLAAVKKALRPKYKTGLDGNAVQSVAKDCRSRRAREDCTRRRARFSFATTPGRRCCNDRSISAPISFFIRRQNISAAIAMFSAELSWRRRTMNFFSGFATFNTKAAQSPRLSIAG